MYSNPPSFGARIAERILNDETLNQQFLGDVKGMADRIIDMRHKLRAGIEVKHLTHFEIRYNAQKTGCTLYTYLITYLLCSFGRYLLVKKNKPNCRVEEIHIIGLI